MMYKCRGKDCGMLIEGKHRNAHIKEVHPRFYNLIKVLHKEGLTKKLYPPDLFEEVKPKRLRA